MISGIGNVLVLVIIAADNGIDFIHRFPFLAVCRRIDIPGYIVFRMIGCVPCYVAGHHFRVFPVELVFLFNLFVLIVDILQHALCGFQVLFCLAVHIAGVHHRVVQPLVQRRLFLVAHADQLPVVLPAAVHRVIQLFPFCFLLLCASCAVHQSAALDKFHHACRRFSSQLRQPAFSRFLLFFCVSRPIDDRQFVLDLRRHIGIQQPVHPLVVRQQFPVHLVHPAAEFIHPSLPVCDLFIILFVLFLFLCVGPQRHVVLIVKSAVFDQLLRIVPLLLRVPGFHCLLVFLCRFAPQSALVCLQTTLRQLCAAFDIVLCLSFFHAQRIRPACQFVIDIPAQALCLVRVCFCILLPLVIAVQRVRRLLLRLECFPRIIVIAAVFDEVLYRIFIQRVQSSAAHSAMRINLHLLLVALIRIPAVLTGHSSVAPCFRVLFAGFPLLPFLHQVINQVPLNQRLSRPFLIRIGIHIPFVFRIGHGSAVLLPVAFISFERFSTPVFLRP